MAGLQKILIVEDNSSIQEIYTTTLTAAGFEVVSALDGKEALEKAQSFKPDLIFLDVMIPGLSGFDVLKVLRADPTYNCQKIKIVMLTNLSQDSQMAPDLEKLTDGYVVKANIDASELVNIINSFDPSPAQT